MAQLAREKVMGWVLLSAVPRGLARALHCFVVLAGQDMATCGTG
jgi:hypothetical protein